MNDLFSIKKEQLQNHVFFQTYCVIPEQELWQGDIIVTNYDTSLVLGIYTLNEVCYLATSNAAIHFFYGSVIISRERLKRYICQEHCILFHNTCSNHPYYNKRFVVDSKKFEYVYFMKVIVTPLFQRQLFIPQN